MWASRVDAMKEPNRDDLMRSPTLGMIADLPNKFQKDFSIEIFCRGNFTRHFEFRVKKVYDRKLMSIPIYLSIGSEFNSAALSMVLEDYNAPLSWTLSCFRWESRSVA